jgi:hypothetical protein
MSYSGVCEADFGRIRCKATDGDFASPLKISNTAGEAQAFVQTALNELLLEQRSSTGVVISTVNLTELSPTGEPVFEGVRINDPTAVGQSSLTATADGELQITGTLPAPGTVTGAGSVFQGKTHISDPTGVGRVVLSVTAGGDLEIEPELPAPGAPISFSTVAQNSIGANPQYARGALIATGTLTLNGGMGAQPVAVPEILDTSTVAVAVSHHLSVANTANYAILNQVAGVGFDIESVGMTDLDIVRWWVYNT